MSRTIDKTDGDWNLTADPNHALDETEDYVLAEGGVLCVTDSRDDDEHVDVSIYPEDSNSAALSITADEALSLGQWLVKTFGDSP